MSPQHQLLAALRAGDRTNPELTRPMSSEEIATLDAWEQAWPTHVRKAAFHALAEARDRMPARPLRLRLAHVIAALRYLPWNPAEWIRWSRRGQLRHLLRQQLAA